MGFIYYVIIAIFMFVFAHLLWKYRKLSKIYKEFPTYPILFYYLYSTLLRKIPTNLPLTGFIFQKFVSVAQKFQDEGLFLLWVPNPLLVIFSEEAVKIFSNEKAALNKSHKYDVLKEGLGDGLVTCNGETWKKHRKLLNPLFQFGELRHKMSIFNDNADNLVKKLMVVTNEAPIDILKFIQECTLSIVCDYTVGLEVSNPENKNAIHHSFEAVKFLGEYAVYRMCYPWMHFKFMLNLTPSGREFIKMKNHCQEFMRKIILETKKSLSLNKISNNGGEIDHGGWSSTSLAEILLKNHMEDPDFTMEYIHNEICTIVLAGYDTISYTIMWSLFLLGHYPEVQEKAFDEVYSSSELPMQYDNLHELKYLECIIKETLRLYPAVPLYGRRLDKYIQYGNYKVPKGTEIVFFPYMLHRNPAVYPEPDKFNPDRFQEKILEKHPWAFIPFSEGLRSCIGKRFAMMEMKVILSHILRHFRITSLTPMEEVELNWIIVLSPTKPLMFKLTPRK